MRSRVFPIVESPESAWRVQRQMAGSTRCPLSISERIGTFSDPHDSVRSHIMRARLIAKNGNADNQIIIVGSLTGTGNGSPDAVSAEVLRLIDQWLVNVAGDHSSLSAAEK